MDGWTDGHSKFWMDKIPSSLLVAMHNKRQAKHDLLSLLLVKGLLSLLVLDRVFLRCWCFTNFQL